MGLVAGCLQDKASNRGTCMTWKVRPESEIQSRIQSSATAEAEGPATLMKRCNMAQQCRAQPSEAAETEVMAEAAEDEEIKSAYPVDLP